MSELGGLLDDSEQTVAVFFRFGRTNAMSQFEFFEVGRPQQDDIAERTVAGDDIGWNVFFTCE